MNKNTKTLKIYEEDWEIIALRKLTEKHKTMAEVFHLVVKEAKL